MKHLIDAHCHIYPDPIARKAVGGISHFYGDLPFDTYDGTLHRLVESGDAYGVEHNIVFSVATTPHQVHSINIDPYRALEHFGGTPTGRFGTGQDESGVVGGEVREGCVGKQVGVVTEDAPPAA